MYALVLNIGALRVGWPTPDPGRRIRKKEPRDSFMRGGGLDGLQGQYERLWKRVNCFSLSETQSLILPGFIETLHGYQITNRFCFF